MAWIKDYITKLATCSDGTSATVRFVIGAYHQLFQIVLVDAEHHKCSR